MNNQSNEPKSITYVLSGEAGQGLATIEDFISETLNKTHYVFTAPEVMSRVRGGNNTVEVRVANYPIHSYSHKIDILFLMNNHSLYRLKDRIHEKTRILGEKKYLTEDELLTYEEQFIEFNVQELATIAGSVLYSNTILLGAIIAMTEGHADYAKELIRAKFESKTEKIREGNIKALELGFEAYEAMSLEVDSPAPRDDDSASYKILTGTDAVGIGALAGGCNFVAAYPMSPSTGVLIYLAEKSEIYDVVIEQAEDEIAALNMVIGSWYAGARGLATTSGGGFALMEEAVSLSGITETPFVLHLAQRPGPGTGLPTRTGQEDLNLVVYSGHGEFPRIVLAPGHLADGIELTSRAFYLADRYQVPVFVLTDQFYLDSKGQMAPVTLNPDYLQSFVVETEKDYKRYQLGDTGISPRGIPGFGEGLVRCDSDEHEEIGMITEDFDMRIAQNDKRLSKEIMFMEEYTPAELIGPKDYSKLIVGWGSTYGVLQEFITLDESNDYAYLYIRQPYPLPKSLLTYFEQAETVITVENNATGQFANLLKLHLDVTVDHQILKYNGEPFSIEEIITRIKEV